MKLKKETKENRKKAMEIAETQIRDLMRNNPTISVDNLVIITGFSEYIIQNIYMKLRRETCKKAVCGIHRADVEQKFAVPLS